MNISDIKQFELPSPSGATEPWIGLSIQFLNAYYAGHGARLSTALIDLIANVTASRDVLSEIFDGYLNTDTLALKNALRDF